MNLNYLSEEARENYKVLYTIGIDIAKLLSPVYENPYRKIITNNSQPSKEETIKHYAFDYYVRMRKQSVKISDEFPFNRIYEQVRFTDSVEKSNLLWDLP